jgi:hypothetical protein
VVRACESAVVASLSVPVAIGEAGHAPSAKREARYVT